MGAPANARPAPSRSSRALLRTNQTIQSRLAEMQMRLERLRRQVTTQREDLNAFDQRLGKVVGGGVEARSFSPSAALPSALVSSEWEITAPSPLRHNGFPQSSVREFRSISPLVVSVIRQQHIGTPLLFNLGIMILSFVSCHSLVLKLLRRFERPFCMLLLSFYRIIISIRFVSFTGWSFQTMDNFLNFILRSNFGQRSAVF